MLFFMDLKYIVITYWNYERSLEILYIHILENRNVNFFCIWICSTCSVDDHNLDCWLMTRTWIATKSCTPQIYLLISLGAWNAHFPWLHAKFDHLRSISEPMLGKFSSATTEVSINTISVFSHQNSWLTVKKDLQKGQLVKLSTR